MMALSREQLAFFVQHGYLVLRPTVAGGADLHTAIFEGASRLDADDELGNNCLPLLPELREVLAAPELRGALSTLLGEDYVLMPHRHCHLQDAGSPGQPFHRDSYFSFEQFRHHLPMEVMVNYYPQPVRPQMGPTALLPGSHYHRGTRFRGAMEFQPGGWGDALEEELMTTDEPGVCVVMHYHLWHRATNRDLDGPLPQLPPRWMFKLQFRRVMPFRAEDSARLLPCQAAAGTNPYAALCISGSGCELPALLQAVKRDARTAWIESHASIWAAVWAALTGETMPRDVEKVNPCMQVEAAQDGLAADVATSTMPQTLVVLGARLASEETPLAERFETTHAIVLGCACGLWPTEAVVAAVLPVLRQIHRLHEDRPPVASKSPRSSAAEDNPTGEVPMQPRSAEVYSGSKEEVRAGVKLSRWGAAEALALKMWLGHGSPAPDRHVAAGDLRWFAVAALHGLSAPLAPQSPDGAALQELVAGALVGEDVEPLLGDWRLEGVLALGVALPPAEAVEALAPLLTLNEPRVQLHAAMALYTAGVRCNAPAHEEWHAAAEKAQLSTKLIEGVHFWAADFAPFAREKLLQELKRRRREGAEKVRGPLQPHDGGGRYALAEMLRCLGRFGSREAALRAAELTGADAEALCAGEEVVWRGRFVRFVESQWLCPITSSFSPF